ncbi:MAG: ethanolamine ammonia-lyase reactivating factor EutA [Candidatus Thorarchaeota archaeon]
MSVIEVDAGRLKWKIIDMVSHFIDSDSLNEQFTQEFDRLLQDNESQEIGFQHLIKAFRPALSSVLESGAEFDRIVSEVSSVLNEALSGVEYHKIQSELDEQEEVRARSAPKTQLIPKFDQPDNLKLLSVGIDVGSSTSHLVFSRLVLSRERSFLNPTNRYQLVDREIIYESEIIFTPLLDRYTIDIEAIVEFCKEEYQKAGINPEMVETGAVIVTGETAKKANAAEIVQRLSTESGKFVSAAAGPNYESVLGAMGSGIVDVSLETMRTILHVDIGGGTSNLAIVSKGHIHSTGCTNVGGRLLGIDEDFKIWRIDEPTNFVMQELGMSYEIGDTIPEEDARTIAREYARALIEVMQGPAESRIAKGLMMTANLDFSIPIDHISFSGGIAEPI